MAYQQKPNSGALFRNDRATKDTHPTHKGDCLIDDTLYWISAWVKEGSQGRGRFFSLAFEPKDQDQTAEDRACAVLGAAYGVDPAEVLARVVGTSQGAQAGRTGASGAMPASTQPPNQYDDDIPF